MVTPDHRSLPIRPLAKVFFINSGGRRDAYPTRIFLDLWGGHLARPKHAPQEFFWICGVGILPAPNTPHKNFFCFVGWASCLLGRLPHKNFFGFVGWASCLLGRLPHKNFFGFVGWASCPPQKRPTRIFLFCGVGILPAPNTFARSLLTNYHQIRLPFSSTRA
ncbi:hypothetical protein MiSe_56120 [Microseira wollei NIES-4236]|uniref:Uncharacterized protein n=1 Tax=Microseira wollei NIES-4236 TaxID=2530354 RepID=A0AAV3XIJ4_9CYAN|nr:hypothetical protein MiSe_56120 [Microseira wollei NIES-4236]